MLGLGGRAECVEERFRQPILSALEIVTTLTIMGKQMRLYTREELEYGWETLGALLYGLFEEINTLWGAIFYCFLL